MNATLASAAAAMQGLRCVPLITIKLAAGQLFVALSGPNFDGSDFVSDAEQQGAAGAVVTSLAAADIAQITVDDTRRALGSLGAAWRKSGSPSAICW